MREDVQQHVGAKIFHVVQQLETVFKAKYIFVFVHRHWQPVAKIVDGDAQNREAFQCAGVLFVEHE